MVAWVGFGGRSQAEIEEVGRAGREGGSSDEERVRY